MNSNYRQFVRCSDCGKNSTETSNLIDPALTLASNCTTWCCNSTSPIIQRLCTCPADYTGPTCNVQLPFRCSIQLIQPDLPCGSINAPYELRRQIYSSSNQCTKFKLASTNVQSFRYALNCSQSTPPLEATTPGASNLTYWYRDSKLALSQNPQMFLQFKVFNFYQLTDDTFAGYQAQTSSHFFGASQSSFGLNFSMIPGLRNLSAYVDYMVGNRMYVEVGLASLIAQPGLESVPYHKTFLDFSDTADFDTRVTPTTPLERFSTTGIALIVLSILALCAFLVIGTLYWIHKQKRPRKTL
jgi:hypothetical protein